MLKTVFAVLLIAVGINAATAQSYVRGHYRDTGKYVSPYYRSNANNTFRDNYDYSGNRNPYTGNYGYKSYSPSYKSYRSYYNQ